MKQEDHPVSSATRTYEALLRGARENRLPGYTYLSDSYKFVTKPYDPSTKWREVRRQLKNSDAES